MRNLPKTLLALSIFVLIGCTASKPTGPFTLAEVAKHNKGNDCWMIINRKVYDVTNYVNGHPGGDIITEGCGTDATTLFETQGDEGEGHSSVAKSLLQSFYIGELVK